MNEQDELYKDIEKDYNMHIGNLRLEKAILQRQIEVLEKQREMTLRVMRADSHVSLEKEGS